MALLQWTPGTRSITGTPRRPAPKGPGSAASASLAFVDWTARAVIRARADDDAGTFTAAQIDATGELSEDFVVVPEAGDAGRQGATAVLALNVRGFVGIRLRRPAHLSVGRSSPLRISGATFFPGIPYPTVIEDLADAAAWMIVGVALTEIATNRTITTLGLDERKVPRSPFRSARITLAERSPFLKLAFETPYRLTFGVNGGAAAFAQKLGFGLFSPSATADVDFDSDPSREIQVELNLV